MALSWWVYYTRFFISRGGYIIPTKRTARGYNIPTLFFLSVGILYPLFSFRLPCANVYIIGRKFRENTPLTPLKALSL
nr:MAG TPA: hypothetical protein [Caudoviricetes sp.]